jgi:hypothetical protein
LPRIQRYNPIQVPIPIQASQMEHGLFPLVLLQPKQRIVATMATKTNLHFDNPPKYANSNYSIERKRIALRYLAAIRSSPFEQQTGNNPKTNIYYYSPIQPKEFHKLQDFQSTKHT